MAGEKVHMLHGAIGSHRDWNGLRRYLESNDFLTESHDLYSYLTNSHSSFDDFTNSFIHSLSEMKPRQEGCHLIGYSLGARLALHLLLENASLWKKAVIVSAHTGLPATKVNEREARIKRDLQWSEMADDVNISWSEFLEEWNQQSVFGNSSGYGTSLDDRLLLESVRSKVAASFRAWSLGRQDDLLERMSSLNVPTLWVVGEEDHKFLKIAIDAVKILPNARLQVIQGAGHRVPWEQPEEFHSLVSEWFLESGF